MSGDGVKCKVMEWWWGCGENVGVGGDGMRVGQSENRVRCRVRCRVRMGTVVGMR